MASEELTSAIKPQEQKQRHFFLLSCCMHASIYMCSRGEECRLLDEGTGMFFSIRSYALGCRSNERPSHRINFVLLERRRMHWWCACYVQKRKKNRMQAKRYFYPQREKKLGFCHFCYETIDEDSTIGTFVLSSSSLIRLLFVVCQKKNEERDCYMPTMQRLDELVSFFIEYTACIYMLQPNSFAYCLCKFDEINKDSSKDEKKRKIPLSRSCQP